MHKGHHGLGPTLRLGLFVPVSVSHGLWAAPGTVAARRGSSRPTEGSSLEQRQLAGQERGSAGVTPGVHCTLGEGRTSQHQESHTLLGPPLLQPSTPSSMPPPRPLGFSLALTWTSFSGPPSPILHS